MTWKRVAWVDVPPSPGSWWKSHASFPTVLQLSPSQFLLLVSCRDEIDRSSCGYLVLELDASSAEVSSYSKRPLLLPGGGGTFDESGVNVTCVVGEPKNLVVWYHGWFLRRSGGWINSIGMATGDLQTGFKRVSRAPVFDRNDSDPTSIGYPFVYPINDNELLFYCSYEKYGVPSMSRNYSYVVKRASQDLTERSGLLLPHLSGCEAQSRPTVVFFDGKHRMFVSVKGEKYRIRAAESADGLSWQWSDEIWNLDPSGDGAEVGEVAYSHVVLHKEGLLMFYNGDRHGATGIGIARWRK